MNKLREFLRGVFAALKVLLPEGQGFAAKLVAYKNHRFRGVQLEVSFARLLRRAAGSMPAGVRHLLKSTRIFNSFRAFMYAQQPEPLLIFNFLRFLSKSTGIGLAVHGGKSTQSHLDRLVTALWAGLGTSAAAKLASAVADPNILSHEIAKAAWALARWHTWRGEFYQAFDQLLVFKLASRTSLREQDIGLEVELLLRLGFLTAARHLVKSAISLHGETAELCLCAANVAAHDPGLGRKRADLVQLKWFNKPLLSIGLKPLELTDPTQPLSLGNIISHCPPVSVELSVSKISVLMPAFNCADTIGIAIDSVLRQSWTNLEILVVDDGSSDGTWSTIQSFAEKDPRVKPIQHNSNRGAYAARNTALRNSSGDFIMAHDTDDWSHPQKFQLQLENLLGNGAPLNTTSSIRVGMDLRVAVDPRRQSMLLRESFPSLVTRRGHALELGGWDEARMGADAEFYARLLKVHRQEKQHLLPQIPLTLQLKRDDSLTSAPFTGLSTTRFGARREYAEASTYWHNLACAEESQLKIDEDRRPFPIPNICLPGTSQHRKYDVLWVGDFSGGHLEASLSADWLRQAKNLGLHSACLHWPSLEFAGRRVDVSIRQLLHEGVAESVVAGDIVKCRLVIVTDALLLHNVPDILPGIDANAAVLLVHQVPSLDDPIASGTILVDAERVFNVTPQLAPVSALVRRNLQAIKCAGQCLTAFDWRPVIDVARYKCKLRPSNNARRPIIGWLNGNEGFAPYRSILLQATRTEHGIEAHIRANETSIRNVVGKIPSNLTLMAPGTVDTQTFLNDLDFLVNYPHFGTFPYSALKGMAAGRPVILPPYCEPMFGRAAVYAEPAEVASVVHSSWNDNRAYGAQIERGLEHVNNHYSLTCLKEYLGCYLPDVR